MPRILLVCLVVVAACGVGERSERPATTPPPTTSSTVALPVALEPPQVTTTTSTTPTPATTVQVDTRAITIAVAGDTSLTNGLDGRDPFGAVGPVLAAADLTIVNMESAIAEEGIGVPVDKEYVFRSPPVTASLLAAAGIDLVSLANNHALDLGLDGLTRTMALLDEAGVGHVGAGRRSEAYAPALVDVGGFRVAVLGASRVLPATSWIATDATIGLASAYDGALATLDAAIAEAAAIADVVIVMVHWGVERDICPADFQRSLAARLIDQGADVIVGSHPHVLQSVEQIGDGWVIYSTGNLAFPSARDESARSAVFLLDVTAGDLQIRLAPLRLAPGGRPEVVSEDGWLADRSLGWVDSGGAFVATDVVGCSS